MHTDDFLEISSICLTIWYFKGFNAEGVGSTRVYSPSLRYASTSTCTFLINRLNNYVAFAYGSCNSTTTKKKTRKKIPNELDDIYSAFLLLLAAVLNRTERENEHDKKTTKMLTQILYSTLNSSVQLSSRPAGYHCLYESKKKKPLKELSIRPEFK